MTSALTPPSTAAQPFQNGVEETFKLVADFHGNSCALGKGLDLASHTFIATESIVKGTFSKVASKVVGAQCAIDIFEALDSIGYFVSGKFKGDHSFSILSNLSFVIAGIGTIAYVITQVFSLVVGLAANLLGRITLGFVGLGFLFMGLNTIRKVIESNKNLQRVKEELADIDAHIEEEVAVAPKIQERRIELLSKSSLAKKQIRNHWIKVAACIIEVVFKAILVAGVTASAILLPLGFIAAGVGLFSFFHDKVINR